MSHVGAYCFRNVNRRGVTSHYPEIRIDKLFVTVKIAHLRQAYRTLYLQRWTHF
jgi:hypothetical protein